MERRIPENQVKPPVIIREWMQENLKGNNFLESEWWSIWKQGHACRYGRKEPLILFWLGQNESSGCVPCIKHFPICISFQFQAPSPLAQDSRWSQLPLCGSGSSPMSERRERWADCIWQCLVAQFLHSPADMMGAGCAVRSLWRVRCSLKARLSCHTDAFVCLLFQSTHLREQQSLEVLEQTVQSRHSVVSLAAGGGFACRSRGWGGDLVYQAVLLCLQGALPRFADCKWVPGVERQTTEQPVEKKSQPHSALFWWS